MTFEAATDGSPRLTPVLPEGDEALAAAIADSFCSTEWEFVEADGTARPWTARTVLPSDDAACLGDRLVEVVMAIIQVKQGQTMTEEEVLDFCKKVNLAKYKWPRKIVFDKVMRNPTGKLMKPQMREKFTGRKEAFKKLA